MVSQEQNQGHNQKGIKWDIKNQDLPFKPNEPTNS